MQGGRPGFVPWVGKIPWRRERLPTPVFWPGEFHELYRQWGGKESNVHVISVNIALFTQIKYLRISFFLYFTAHTEPLRKHIGFNAFNDFPESHRVAGVVVVQLLSCFQLFVIPWTTTHQGSLSFTVSWSSLKFMSTELMMASNHLIFLPSSPPALNLSQHQSLFQ